MGQHSMLGASVMARRLGCPGSLRMCRDIPSESSVYAREGTAAHTLGEKCLRENKVPEEYMGVSIQVEEDTFIVDEDMAEAVGYYVADVRNDHERLQPGAKLHVEKSFNLDWFAPGLNMYGTNDACIEQFMGLLVVDDYKHGKGVLVSAEDNVQLKYYALGALWDPLMKEAKPFTKIICKIWQPRAPGDKCTEAIYKPKDLAEWGYDVLLPGAKACLDPDAPLHAGDWCQFCPATHTCPEIRRQTFEASKIAFEEHSIIPSVGSVAELPSVEELTPEETSKVLSVLPLIEPWIKAVKAHALDNMQRGKKYPGFKLVRGRASRKWIDEAEAIAQLEGVLGDGIYAPQKLKSVAQMEKALKKIKHEGAWGDLFEVTRGVALASESDRREEYIPSIEIFKEE